MKQDEFDKLFSEANHELSSYYFGLFLAHVFGNMQDKMTKKNLKSFREKFEELKKEEGKSI